MENTLSTIAFIIMFLGAKCQIETPVKWSYAAKKSNKNEAIIFLKVTIDKQWHIYSINQKDGGPIKTSFVFEPSKDYVLVGKVTEPKPVTKFEKTFGIDVTYFENEVIFQQKVRLKAAEVTVKGKVNFMACNDKKCLPPDNVEFTIPVK